MKKLIILLFNALLICGVWSCGNNAKRIKHVEFIQSSSTPATSELKEGDIVFQTSSSQQAPLIIAATRSPWSHCGVIIEKPDGLYVLEAISKVSLTPYQQWVERGVGKRVEAKRYSQDPIKIKYSKYLGKSYDLAFKFDNSKWYCSELVYDIYKRQLGVELCEPRPVSDYSLNGLDKQLSKRNIDKNQLVVAPSDLHDSKLLANL